MKWENIHIYHIKPVSAFDFNNHDDFLDCCHYSNIQPLLVEDNLTKAGKWSEKDEEYWQENIRGTEYTVYAVIFSTIIRIAFNYIRKYPSPKERY